MDFFKKMGKERMMKPLLDMFGNGESFRKLLDAATEKYTKGVKNQRGHIIQLKEGEKIQFMIGDVKREVRLTFVALSSQEGKLITRPLESLEMKGFIELLLSQ